MAKNNSLVKKTSAEEYLATIIASSLEALEESKPIEEKIDMFLDSIGLPKNEKVIKQSFIAASKVEKVAHKWIMLELTNVLPNMREEIIKATMNNVFKEWLINYPDVKENYPHISFMALLKVFAKKIK